MVGAMNKAVNQCTGYLIYNRKSTDDAESQKNSLAYQRQRNVAYAVQEKLPIAALTKPGYCENGIEPISRSA